MAAIQSASAPALLRSKSRRWIILAVAGNAAVVVVWGLSRTTGLPGVGGAASAEPIGFKDGIATLLELAVIAGAGLLAVLPEAARRVVLPTAPLASTVIAAGVWGLGVSGLMAGHEHGSGHLHGGGGHTGGELAASHEHPGQDHTGADTGDLADGGPDAVDGHTHPAFSDLAPGPVEAAHAAHGHAGPDADGSLPHRHAAASGRASSPLVPADDHGHEPGDSHGHQAGDGHQQQPAEEHEPGDDHEHEPGDDHEHEPGDDHEHEPGPAQIVSDIVALLEN